jgi:hypothetical protein
VAKYLVTSVLSIASDANRTEGGDCRRKRYGECSNVGKSNPEKVKGVMSPEFLGPRCGDRARSSFAIRRIRDAASPFMG